MLQSLITPEIRSLLGKEDTFPGADPVEKGTIKRYCLAVGDLNPLYLDEAYARRMRHGRLIAPSTFIFDVSNNYAAPFGADGRPASRVRLPPPLTRIARGGNEYEWLQPIGPGDLITATRRIAEMTEKQGRSGPLVFVISETRYTNQKGEKVAVNRETLIFMPDTGKKPGKPSVEAFPLRNAEGYAFAGSASERRDGPVFFEDAQASVHVPSLTKKVSLVQMLQYSAATWSFYLLHLDQEFAHKQGFRDANVHGPLHGAILAQMLVDWIGVEGDLVKLGYNCRVMVFPGDTMVCKGTVTGKRQIDGRNLVDLDVWIESAQGQVMTPGRATVALPLRMAA
ncbi:MAG: MaoC family dehydratase N-terminal domain-containing protein [Chloroflexi bacterium]|nr:MaoC family dehydratase N-terminal domain-containing protein [Chloroflexota bacterium]